MLPRIERPVSRACLWALLLASGCVLGAESPVTGPPNDRPPPREEAPGKQPPGCKGACEWSSGYWHWDGGGYSWVSGRWVPRSVSDSGR